MLKLGRMVDKGKPIYAAEFNRLIEDLERALNVKAGFGLRGAWNGDGLMLQLAMERPDFLEWARVTRVYGADPDVAENVRYDAAGIFSSAVIVTNVYPSCGRPVKTAQAGIARIRPAAMGCLCFIAKNKQLNGTIRSELWFPGTGGDYEGLSVKKCTGTGDPAPGGGIIGGDDDQPVHGGTVGRGGGGWSGVMAWLRK